jgi:Raf kinase inhibitor-like YbhB/YbcL family protein
MLKFVSLLLFSFLSLPIYAADMTLSSQAFADGMAIPVLYTCDGKDISPDLHWSNLPAKTQSIAIILSDEDAPNGVFYHWVLFNIPTKTTELAEATTTLAGKNTWGKSQYNGPCPPKGALHHYTFTLYALDEKLSLPATTDAPTLLKTMQGHILGQATLKMGYSRWPV